jgi:hypothetical protein
LHQEYVYEKARTYFALDSDGCRHLCIAAIASLIMHLIVFLLLGVSMLARGLLMWKEKKKAWQPWVIVGLFMLITTFFSWI